MPIAFGVAGFSLSREQRIEQLIAGAGGPARVAEALKVSRQTLYNWTKPGAKLPFDEMLELARLNGISTDWIATGYDRRPDLPPLVGGSMTVLYRYETGPSGQLVEVADHGGDIAFRDDWLSGIGIVPAQAGLLPVRDDAMAPAIRAGATLIVDRSVKAVGVVGIYVLLIGDALAVRHAQQLRDRSVKIIANDPLIEPEIVPAHEVAHLRIAGLARAVISRL